MDSPDSILAVINRSLQDGWQAKLNQDGRLYYTDHNNRLSQWIPPPTCWSPRGDLLPYGWEEAVDKNGKRYYINHVTCTTTREDPYDVEDIPPVERNVTLQRDRILGFGFIAGSEKPVVVRSVTEGGPSVGKLLPADKILRLNGEDVEMKDGPYIIERIRQSSDVIRLTVIQPYIDKTGLKSSFLSANKKQKLKSKPSRVRFADNVKAAAVVQGKSPPSLVYLPSVLKVYLENGQTKSFKYDNKTSVKEVLRNLKEKLALKSMDHFALVVQNMEDLQCSNKLTILQEDETLTQIASRPGSQNWKCLLRVTFVPQDAYDLLSKDPKAFDYFYMQCCNDIINERFMGELNNDKAVRLAAIQIQQHFLSNKHSAKVSLKALEKEDGVERFLPPSVAKKMKAKELKRLISQHIKQSQCLCTPGQKHLTELQAKLHYLKIVCDLRSFGGMFFTGSMVQTDVHSDRLADYHCTVLVGPKCGITEVISLRDNMTSLLADFSQVTDIQLIPLMISGDCIRVELHVKNEKPIVLLLTHDDAYDLVTLVNGYYRLFVDNSRSLLPSHYSHSQEIEAPAYHSKHRVISAEWNYPNDLASELIRGSEEEIGQSDRDIGGVGEGEYIVDLSIGPPEYEDDVAYINRLKSQGRYHPLEAAGGQPDGAVMYFTIYEEMEDEEDDHTLHRNANTLHRNANNSLDTSSNLSKSDTSTVSFSSWNDKSLDLACISDMVEDMYEIKTPDTGREDSPLPQESRLEMTIDGSDEIFLETEENQVGKTEHRKSLTKHFDVSDSVAIYPSLDENKNNKGQVKLLHYAIYNDDSLIPVKEIHHSLTEDGTNFWKGNEEENIDYHTTTAFSSDESVVEQKAILTSQDSVTLAHCRKVHPQENNPETSEDANHKDSKMESFRNFVSYSNSSVDSDIVDLTQVSLTDSSAGEDSPCSQTKVEIPPLDLSAVYLGDTELDEHQDDVRGSSDSPVPVSIIDLPSPDPDEDKNADQAHGIKLAALDSNDVDINQRGELLQRSVHRDPECESDSGNETISSEIIDNGVTDEPGASHSPSDYFSMIRGQKSTIESIDRNTTPTPEQTEEIQEQEGPPNLVTSCLGSDTDSVSTLHGSSPNLSALEAPERASESQEQVDNEESVDDLIASLIISPPPSVESVELDEELLNAVIPPPPVSDFDIGVIDSLVVPPPPESPAASTLTSLEESPTRAQSDCRYSTTILINLAGGKALGQEIKALEIQLPEKPQKNCSTLECSPREDSPVKQQASASLEMMMSPANTSPRSPATIQASPNAGEPHPSHSQEKSRPQKFSSSMMSSSQDSGFCQLEPGDLDQRGAVTMVVEDVREAEQTALEEERQSGVQETERVYLRDEEISSIDIRSCEDDRSLDGDNISFDGDEFRAVKTLQNSPDSVSVVEDKIGMKAGGESSRIEVQEDIQSFQLRSESLKPTPIVTPKPAVRPKISRQESVDSLNGGDFDTSEPSEKLELKKTFQNLPVPPPRKRYSPGLAKKSFQFDLRQDENGKLNSSAVQRSLSLKINFENGDYLRKMKEPVKPMKRSSSFAEEGLHLQSSIITSPTDGEDIHQDSGRGEDGNFKSGEMRNVKTALGPRLSRDIELRHVSEISRPIVRSNTFSTSSTSELTRIKRQAPLPPPKPIKKKESPFSEVKQLSPKEKKSFRNTISSSSPSSVTKLLSPKRNFSFLRGPKHLFKGSSKADESVQSSSTPKEKKESRRPRPLRAFRSLSRKDSYDVSMFDQDKKRDNAGEPTFRESSSLRSVGGLHRPDSLHISDNAEETDAFLSSLVSRRVSLYESRSKSEDSDCPTVAAHQQLRQSQSVGRAARRPVSYPSSPQKYPGPGSIHASLPKRPPPPRPNNPPASPRKAMYPSDESLSSSSSELLPSPVPLPSPSGFDRESTDSDDFSPPPMPVSLPPVKSRPRALPEHFIPPSSIKSPQSNVSSSFDLPATDSYTVELESKEYTGKHSISDALGDIQLLITELQACIQAETSAPSLMQFKVSKNSLISEVREFTSNTKMLVSSAGQSEEQLVRSINSSMHTLARLCSDAQQMMKAMVSVMQATNLGNKTKEVAANFSSILSAAAEAHGRNLHDPTMQLLLRQAQTMAVILSALMRTLRMLQS